jgi:glycosyltransferase involved in cell wall biosynthesis
MTTTTLAPQTQPAPPRPAPESRPLRILQANKFFYLRGGSERCYFDTIAGLEKRGHHVIPFAMEHERNEPSPYDAQFVSHVDFHAGGGPLEQAKRAWRFVYSKEAKVKLAALITRERPDVVHLHNIAHQLTPSIIDACREFGVPVVQTLHDYKLVCSSYLLLANGSPCERCRGGRHYQALLTRCHHGSLTKSALGFLEMAWHAGRKSYRGVDAFICPSQFMRDTCVTFGIDSSRLEYVPYFVDAARYRPEFTPGTHALYVGRLSHEKGVGTLLEAAERSALPLRLAGEGPLRPELEARARAANLDVTFLGYLEPDPLHEAIRDAAFVVVPSEWYENLPYAVLETFALGTPVVGAEMGGIPEMVRPGETGELFRAGDAAGLAAVWRTLIDDPARVSAMGRAARTLVETTFAPRTHLDRLDALYRRLAA